MEALGEVGEKYCITDDSNLKLIQSVLQVDHQLYTQQYAGYQRHQCK